MSRKQKFLIAVKSTLSLLLAWALLQLMEGALLEAGARLSGFNGQVVWHAFVFRVPVQQGDLKQIFFLSLFPWLVFVLWLILFPVRFNPAKNKHEFFRLLKAWIFLLVLVRVLWMPAWETVYRTGIYPAFHRFRFFGYGPYLTAIVLFLGFLMVVFRISALFAGSLPVRPGRFLKSGDIRPHLLYLWAVPFVVLLLLLVGVSGLKPGFFNGYFLGGIAFALLVNTPYISSYKVIVR